MGRACISLSPGSPPPDFFGNHLIIAYTDTMDLNILNVDSHSIVAIIAEYIPIMACHEVFEAII